MLLILVITLNNLIKPPNSNKNESINNKTISKVVVILNKEYINCDKVDIKSEDRLVKYSNGLTFLESFCRKARVVRLVINIKNDSNDNLNEVFLLLELRLLKIF